jgi:hypothetical protein
MVNCLGSRLSSFHPSQVRSLGAYDGRRRDAFAQTLKRCVPQKSVVCPLLEFHAGDQFWPNPMHHSSILARRRFAKRSLHFAQSRELQQQFRLDPG